MKKYLLVRNAVKKMFFIFILIAFASALRAWPLQSLESSLTWITYYPAVIIAAIYGGLYAGFLAIALACLTSIFLWPLFVTQPFINTSGDWLGMLVFVINCSLVSGIIESSRRFQRREMLVRKQLQSASLYNRSLIEASQDPLVTISIDGKITDVNCATELVTGRSRWELVGTDFSDYFTEPDKAREGYLQVFSKGYVTDYQLSLCHIDGHVTDVLYNASVYRNEEGDVLGVFAAARDITERKKAELERELYFKFFINSPIMMGIADPNGCFKKINPAFTNTLGYSEKEILSKPFIEFVHPDDRQLTLDEMTSQLQRGYSLDFENRYLCKDNSFRWLSWRANINYDEGLTYASAKDITERKKMEDDRQANQQRLELAIKCGQMGVWELDLIDHTAYRSLQHDNIFGYKSLLPQWTFEMFLEHVLLEDRSEINRIFNVAVANHTDWDFECRIRRVDGEVRWIWAHGSHHRDVHGVMRRMIGLVQDITERKRSEASLLRLNRALSLLSKCNSVLVHADDEHELLSEICQLTVESGGYLMAWVGYAEQNDAKTIRMANQFGYEDGYLDSINISWADTESGHGPTSSAIRSGVTVVSQSCLTNPEIAPWHEAAVKRGYQSSVALPLICKRHVLGALTIYSSDQLAFTQEELSLLEELANDLAYGIQTLRTRAAHNASTQKIEYLAHYDALTSLPNRILLRDRFDQAVAFANRNKTNVAILLLDLDNFKRINDNLGHEYGDKLLIQVALMLKKCIRDTDTISRQGGDEFIILLNDMFDVDAIQVFAQSIIEAFAEPISVDDNALNTSFSFGISLFPKDGTVFDELLKKADTALYQAKDAGKNTYRFFAEEMNIDALEHIKLEGQLRKAIREQEFILHYQPQVEINSGRIIGAEALVRWMHPELGLISPGKFIPLAERCGLIIPLGEWVLNEACRQAQIWRETFQQSPFVIAVNLSALQFRRGDIVETVSKALSRSGLPANHLELELTESILLHDIEIVMKSLQQLKEVGVKLSIDDFGTGYSSLTYLKRLAVDKLKIDQSFVFDMVDDSEDAAIVKAIIQLGKTLKLTTIAEGVEDDAQLTILRNYGCDEAQGYLFSHPLPAAEFTMFEH